LHTVIRATAHGFSLIEVLVTLIILSIGLLGLAALQTTSVREGFDSGQRSQATWLAQELVERMRANPGGQKAGYTAAAADANLCTSGPAKYCSDHFDGVGKADAEANCSANELAEFDVLELTCGFVRANTISGSQDHLRLTGNGLALACVDSDGTDADPCSTGSNFTATLTWTSSAADHHGTNEATAKTMSFVVRP
jgi:type IV pilus assembly protein PilV